MAPLLACVLAACGGGAPSVNVGGPDGTVDSPPDSGTTSPGKDAGTGTGTGDAGTVDSGTCPGSVTCSGSDAGTGTGSDAGTEVGSDAGTGTGSDAGTEAGSDAGTEVGSDAGTGTGSDAGTEVGSDAGTGTGSDAGTGSGSDAGTGPGSDAGMDADGGSGPGSDAGMDADGGSGPGSDAGTGSDAGMDADAGSGPGSDAGTGTDAGTGSDGGVAPLSASSGGDKVICAGQSVSIGLPASGGMAPYAYAWSASPVCTGCFDSTTVASPTVTPPVSTTFTQAVTDALLQSASADTLVTVLPNPGSAGAGLYLDSGASTVIGPTPVSGASYAWSCNRADCALSATNVAQPVAAPTRSTTYTLDATSGPGCSVRSTMTVQVNLRADTVPQDGALAFPLNSDLLVQFDQPIAPATLSTSTVQLVDALSGSPVAISFSYDAASRQLRVKPVTSLASGTDYTLTLVGGPSGIASDDPVLPNLLPSDVQVDFTTATADTTPPGIYFRSPGVGALNVANNTTVAVTFTEAVDPTTVTGANFTLTSPAGSVTGSVRYDPATWTATFTPSALMATNTQFTASVAGIKDLSGNAMTTATAGTSWSFTTGAAADTTPPTVQTVVPANGSSAVASSDPIVVTFSEPTDTMTLFTGIRLFQVSSGTYVAGTITYDPTQRIATFTPTVLLGSLTTYEVQVNGVKDLAGNAMAAPFTSRFTTRRTLFADNFEGGAGAWNLTSTTGVPWSLTTANFHSSNHSLTDSSVGKYAANVTSTAELASPLNVSGLTSVSVQFWMKVRTEKNKDFVYVDASVDGGAWTQIGAGKYAGNLAWATRSLNLTLSGNSTLRIRYRFTSNNTKFFDGVYVDDIIVQSP